MSYADYTTRIRFVEKIGMTYIVGVSSGMSMVWEASGGCKLRGCAFGGRERMGAEGVA